MLKPGTQLGPYEILSKLGAGGMGEVYKARDTRLDRFVGVKTLPDHLSDNTDLRERFGREARTIAKLNHPHICTLHDIGSQDGADFLVMEYLEGETLAERLKKGPLPLNEVLRYAVEVSDALDKAHRAGITHRDIKPGNIIVTKTGTKLLDFGLAKLKQEVFRSTTPASEMPTVQGALTGQGTLLGTLHYMAPEQVEGKINQVDARTDIFAFGALVYEMATGKRAFPGETQASVIAKIMEVDPPPMSELESPGKMTPPVLDRVVKTCLAKDQEDRWQSMRDVCRELNWIVESPEKTHGTETVSWLPASVPLWRRAIPFAMTALAAAAAAAGITIWNRPVPTPQPISRLAVPLPPGDRVDARMWPSVAISPDGTHIVYTAAAARGQQLYLRSLDNTEVKPIPATQGGLSPFFSPDGAWIGFFVQERKLMKVALSGGPAQTVCDPCAGMGATWGPDDTIVFSQGDAYSLWRVPAAGGMPTVLTQPDSSNNEDHLWPAFLPGGNTILFVSTTNLDVDNGQIEALNLDSGERQVLVRGGTYPRYASTGHLVYQQGSTMMAVPFDPERLEVTGAPAPVLEGVMPSIIAGGLPNGSGAAQFGFSQTGSLVFVSGTRTTESSLVWVDRNGAVEPLGAPPRSYLRPSLSPDGRRIAVNIQGETGDVWIFDIVRRTLTRLTFAGNNTAPIWTPDGERIVFPSVRGGPRQLFWKRADGSGAEEQLTNDPLGPGLQSISPDGKLAFGTVNPGNPSDIGSIELQGERKVTVLLKTPFDEGQIMISPDGRWLAYLSLESGRSEIYVVPFPGLGGKYQISTEGGVAPVWSRDGRELFYVSSTTGNLMAVDVTTQPAFQAGTPRVVLEGGGLRLANNQGRNYDVSPDGRRFLTVQGGNTNLTQINVVLNWFEELKQRVPVGQ